MANIKRDLPHSDVARKGGKSTLDKYGRDHFIEMAKKSVEVRKRKGVFPFNKKK